MNYISVTICVDPSLNQESNCVDEFDARIVLAQNIKSVPSTTTVVFAVDGAKGSVDSCYLNSSASERAFPSKLVPFELGQVAEV